MIGIALSVSIPLQADATPFPDAPQAADADFGNEDTVQFHLEPQLSTQKGAERKNTAPIKKKSAPMPDMNQSRETKAPPPAVQNQTNAPINPQFNPMNPVSIHGGTLQSQTPGVQIQGHTQMNTRAQNGIQNTSQGQGNNTGINIGGIQKR